MKRILLVLLLCGSCFGATVISQWKLNDNLATNVILDAEESHNGVVKDDTGVATSQFHSIAGHLSNAQVFDGTDDHIEITSHADFSPVGTAFSVAAWVYIDTAANFAIVSRGDATNDEWKLIAEASYLEFSVFDASESAKMGRRFLDAEAVPTDEWFHVVGTYDGGTSVTGINIYQNGDAVDDTSTTSNVFVSVEALTSDIYIGRYVSDYADGLIDNVVIFSTELTQDEVTYLYNGGTGTEETVFVVAGARSRYSNGYRTSYRNRYNF